MLIADRRGDDTGRGRGHEGLDERLLHFREYGAELRQFFGNGAVVDVAHIGDRLWHREIAHGVLAGKLRLERRFEHGIALDIGSRPALPAAAEAGHAMAEIEKEALALLLA